MIRDATSALTAANVDPARAGMILLGIMNVNSEKRRPRASGDDPFGWPETRTTPP